MNILVLAPHTDDAEIGCGGSMNKWVHEGHKIRLVAFSNCVESIPEGFDKNVTRDEFYTNIDSLGIEGRVLDFGVRHFPEQRQRILDYLIRAKDEFKPGLVVGTSLNDLHQDHKTVAEEMVRAFRETASIISYELPYSNINFNHQLFINLTVADLNKKAELLENYKSQKYKHNSYFTKEYVFARSKTLGIKIKKDYVETFEVVRWLIP